MNNPFLTVLLFTENDITFKNKKRVGSMNKQPTFKKMRRYFRNASERD
jgi:hypothetical protein